MARSDFRFSFPKRVRMAEVDAAAIVFNARYLEYLDIALSEYLRALFGEVTFEAPIRFARSAIDYRAPCRFDELIDLCIACRRIGRTSITFAWAFHGAGPGDDLRCEGESVVVHVDDERPAPVPDWLIAAFEGYEGRRLRA